MRQTRTHTFTRLFTCTHDNLTTSMALPRHPSAHGNRAAGTQGDRNDISEAFQLIRPVPLTLSESMMTNIYRMGGGGTRAREGPTGQGLVAMAKDRPGKLPTGSRRQDTMAATAALSPWALRPVSSPGTKRWWARGCRCECVGPSSRQRRRGPYS